ncbi:hypothetical protein PRIPAC_91754 [Pristionchus pacificus]|uniref:Uncharacterized protein n=1 Tax=Pristionchus pacificus TaxID=54126 RepID=A0A2A6CHA4_PRIPA|nr:hypothetical protein PRIPAC_91754 [Pristionchus pacificus]|eukprot:PDM77605.1 hypothetical protein PRIPAC_34472 [Pristionchus pacificus]
MKALYYRELISRFRDLYTVFRSGTIARVDVAMKHTLEVRQDAAEEPRPDEPRVSHRPRTLQVTKSATPSCPTRDLWTRCSWMRNLARRLPSVRPVEAAEEACEETASRRLSTFLSLLDFTHCL